jgi:phage-related protein
MEAGYRIEFYADADGDRPVHRWLTGELSARQRRALGVAMFEYLQRYGAGVCSSEFGKALGDGLYEFRLRHDLPELVRRSGGEYRSAPDEGSPQKMLLRVFFAVYGDRVVLLLGGYDKAKTPGTKRQQSEIETARARLREWKRRNSG